jgi:hypothetical protein
MSSTTVRCDRILALIDACLAGIEIVPVSDDPGASGTESGRAHAAPGPRPADRPADRAA